MRNRMLSLLAVLAALCGLPSTAARAGRARAPVRTRSTEGVAHVTDPGRYEAGIAAFEALADARDAALAAAR